VTVFNLGLTVFVKHQVNWLNRFCSLPSGKEKTKQLKGKNLKKNLCFCPLPEQKPPECSCSFSFHRKHICLTGYIGGQKFTFIRSPHPYFYRGPSSGHASPLGYFDRVYFFNYKRSAGRGKLGLPGSQGKQASQNR
jgi:hypothetical protein